MQLPNLNKRNRSLKKKSFVTHSMVRNCSKDRNHSLWVVLLESNPREPYFPSDICETNHLEFIWIKEELNISYYAWWVVNRICNSSFLLNLLPLRTSPFEKPCSKILGWDPSGKAITELIRENIKNATCSWLDFFLKMLYSSGTPWLLFLPRIDFYHPGLTLSDCWLLMNIYHPNLPNKIYRAVDCILALISHVENQGCIISEPGNISKHKDSWSKATLCSVQHAQETAYFPWGRCQVELTH